MLVFYKLTLIVRNSYFCRQVSRFTCDQGDINCSDSPIFKVLIKSFGWRFRMYTADVVNFNASAIFAFKHFRLGIGCVTSVSSWDNGWYFTVLCSLVSLLLFLESIVFVPAWPRSSLFLTHLLVLRSYAIAGSFVGTSSSGGRWGDGFFTISAYVGIYSCAMAVRFRVGCMYVVNLL